MAAEDTCRVLIRMALAEAGMSQADVARKLGLSQKHVSQLLTGRTPMSMGRFEDFLGACGMRSVLSYRARKIDPQESE